MTRILTFVTKIIVEIPKQSTKLSKHEKKTTEKKRVYNSPKC